MKGNFDWFLEHYDEIYELCGICHVVIKDKKIIGVFVTDRAAYDWVRDTGLLGKCSVQYCNGEESAYTLYTNF